MQILLSIPLLGMSSTLYKYFKRFRFPRLQLKFELNFSIRRLTVVYALLFPSSPSADPSAELVSITDTDYFRSQAAFLLYKEALITEHEVKEALHTIRSEAAEFVRAIPTFKLPLQAMRDITTAIDYHSAVRTKKREADKKARAAAKEKASAKRAKKVRLLYSLFSLHFLIYISVADRQVHHRRS